MNVCHPHGGSLFLDACGEGGVMNPCCRLLKQLEAHGLV